MAGTLVQSEFLFTSGVSPKVYRFTISVGPQGAAVRDVENPQGVILNPSTTIPRSVVDDISAAMGQVENILAMTSAVNGSLTFTAESEKTVTFSTPLPDANYRVALSASVFAPFRITSKTTAGFVISAGAVVSGQVGYDVWV